MVITLAILTTSAVLTFHVFRTTLTFRTKVIRIFGRLYAVLVNATRIVTCIQAACFAHMAIFAFFYFQCFHAAAASFTKPVIVFAAMDAVCTAILTGFPFIFKTIVTLGTVGVFFDTILA